MFKKIDPSLIYSDEILNWSLFETRAYLVFASYAQMNTGEFFIKHETLAKKIESSKSQARRIISKFNNKGIISTDPRPARSNIYTFNLSTMTTLQGEVPSQSIANNDPIMNTLNVITHENQDPKMPETLTTKQSTSWTSRCSSDKPTLQADLHDFEEPKNDDHEHHNKKQHIQEALLTTTTDGPPLKSYMEILNEEPEPVVVFKESVRKENESINAGWIPVWIDDLEWGSRVKKHGLQYVYDRAIAIDRANGRVHNKRACFRDSLDNNYIYSCKETEQAYTNEKHNKFVDEHIKKMRQENKQMLADRKKSKIQQVDLLGMFSSICPDEQTPHNVGYAE